MNLEARRRFELRLAEIRQGFVAHLGQYADELAELELELARGGDPALIQKIHRAVHSLAGTASTFKLFPLGLEARELAADLAALGPVFSDRGDVKNGIMQRMRRVTTLAREAASGDGGAG